VVPAPPAVPSTASASVLTPVTALAPPALAPPAPMLLDLPGPSRRVRVEPVELPVPARPPTPPERTPEPPPPDPRREPVPDREPVPA